MNAIRQRIADFLRERRIAALRRKVTLAMQDGMWSIARGLNADLTRECSQRSPAQVARMERARGLRPALKQSLIAAHCNGVLPAFAVRAAFRVFRLRGQ